MLRATVVAAAAGIFLAVAQAAAATTLRTLVIRATWGPPVMSAEVAAAELQRGNEFLQRSSFGKLSLQLDITPTINGFHVPDQCFGDGPGLGPVGDAAKAAAAQIGYDVAAYDRYVYVFPDHICGLGGVGTGNEVMLASPEALNWLGFVHEFGHTLGFAHATRSTCISGCRIIEYGDPYSPMGIGSDDFSAWEKFRVGWVTNVTTVSKSGRYPLGSPQEQSGLPQALVVKTSLGAFWVEDTHFDKKRLIVRVVRTAHPGRSFVQSIYLSRGTQTVTVAGLFRVTRAPGSAVFFKWLDPRHGRR